MRIDAASLIAAQSAGQPQRPTQAASRSAQMVDKPLFELLNFPKAEPAASPARPPGTGQHMALRRPGAQLDITV